MLEIDGSFGEGGGQILRSSLTLSCLTGRGFRIRGIRAKRKNPGLQPQHLASVRVMKMLTNARVRGDYLGSTELAFEPGNVIEGDFSVDVGTAGSVTLIAMTAIPVMINRKISLRIRGGTDVPLSPPVDYMRLVLIPVLEKMGITGKIEVKRRGHYPEGGGEVVVYGFRGEPSDLVLSHFGELREIRGISHVTSLPSHIARRQVTGAMEVLKEFKVPVNIEEEITKEGSKGTGIVLAAYGSSVMGANSIGEIGVTAENVGRKAGTDLVRELKTGAGVDSHMGDMLVIFSAFANLEYSASFLTQHTETNIEVTRKFLGVDVTLEGKSPSRIRIRRK
ncbi:RNA 3'-terminal phosphate cyclase [Metallosphaera sp. J1]|uniref:RNA 3'-terminal phosphate cyclase n=1 Tax=Metallosphaera javensis (ex Hofmann et al. 2022) TaxID=99938 RepID=UPI001EDDFB36|nr:RNA 3'-terminal phosphate cyclase [Metallosphaera javensis (ex Hofmann et al. 2022)]MCG3108363.1 RNA 3'-terminal phosphate cyclase [Metallosphaera javensis (ex Hofmann et al. 2022)]